jgi:oligopeptide transport system substrate-binding protein
LRLLEAEDVQTLDPIYAVDEVSVAVGFELYEGLTRLGPDNSVTPGLAARWDIGEEGRLYVFHLRTDARFHSGRPVTAEAVRWSWTRAIDPGLASPLRFLLRPLGIEGGPATLDRVVARDEHSLEVRLPEPANDFLTLLALPPLWAVDREAVEGDPGWAEKATSAGSGPYRLTAWERDKRLEFEATGTRPLRAAKVTIEIVREAAQRLTRVRNGAADLAHGLGALSQLEARGDPSAVTVAAAPGLRSVWLGFNLERAPGSDRRFREALAQAIDRDRLADLALTGRTVGSPSFTQVPPAISGHLDHRAYAFDPTRAKALWEQAGRPAVSIWFSAGDLNRRVAQELAAQLTRALGAAVELHSEGFSDFIQRRSAGEFPVFLGGWTGDYPHPRAFLEPLDTSGAQFNDFRLRDPDVDRLVSEGNRRLPGHSNPSYQDAERRVLDLAALVPLYTSQEGFAAPATLAWPIRPEPWSARWEEARQTTRRAGT